VTSSPYLDTLGIWDAAGAWPEHITTGLATTQVALRESTWIGAAAVSSVVLLGVGRAVAAVAAYGSLRSNVPLLVCDGYEVPAFVGPGTAVLAVSYSGMTAETVAAAQDAHERGASVAVITSGGDLAAWATREALAHLPIEGSFPVGRSALAAEVTTLLLALSHIGVLADVTSSLHATAALLTRRRAALLAIDGPAATMARHIGRTMPVVYGAAGLGAVAAQSWKSDINENAKTAAFVGTVPAVSHQEVAGWGQHGDVTRQVFTLVTLRLAGEHRGVAQQFELVVAATDEVMADVIPLWAEGDDDLSQFFDLAAFGLFVSLHLAGRESIDPGPVPALSDVAGSLH
jgi:glucose/mannose-6-phosphate isomerase